MKSFEYVYDDLNISSITIHGLENISEKTLEHILYCENWNINKSIKPDYINIPHIHNGYFDQYSIIVKNLNKEDIKFLTRILYQNIEHILPSIKQVESNQELLNHLQNNKMLATFKFIDEKSRLSITGELGYNAKLVMEFVLNSIFNSFQRNKGKIQGFYYTILRSELKRMKFYDYIIEKSLQYNQKFVDETSDQHKISVYYLF